MEFIVSASGKNNIELKYKLNSQPQGMTGEILQGNFTKVFYQEGIKELINSINSFSSGGLAT